MPFRILALALLLPLVASAGEKKSIPPAPKPLPAGVREISLEEADKLIRDRPEVAVLDVRTPEEFEEQGHLPRARLVDFLREDFAPALATLKLDPAKPCVVYCAIGGRARRAAETMAQLGFQEILLPKGSFKAWKEAGKTIEGGRKK